MFVIDRRPVGQIRVTKAYAKILHMKQLFFRGVSALLAGLLVLPLFYAPIAGAQGVSPSNGNDMPVSSNQAQREPKKTPGERLAERKERMTTRLTLVQQNIMKSRCAVAAPLVGSAKNRAVSFGQKRPAVYQRLLVRLQALSPKLKAAGVVTTTYDERLLELKTKTDTLQTAVTELQTSLEDLSTVNCTADPEGFIVTAREVISRRRSVIATSKEIRTYLREQIKPLFVDFTKQLAGEKKEES